MPRSALSGAAGSFLFAISYLRLVVVFPSVFQVVEEFLFPLCPRISVPGTLSSSRVTLVVSSPWGNSSTPGLSVPLSNLSPPLTP